MGNQFSSFVSPAAGASSLSSSTAVPLPPPPEGEGPVMDDEAIRAVMNAEGPIVQMVVLKADGTVEELTVDCTPRARNIEKLMESDSMTIVGGYQDLDLTVVNGTSAALLVSSAKLPFPLHAHVLRGTTVIMRNGDDGAQLDFTAAEFQALVARPVSAEEQRLFQAENVAIAMKQAQHLAAAAANEGSEEEDSDASGDEYTAADAEEDEASSSEEEDDEEEGEGEEVDEEMAQKSSVLFHVIEMLAAQLERAPTMDEIKQALRDITAAQANGSAAAGDDEEEESEEECSDELGGSDEEEISDEEEEGEEEEKEEEAKEADRSTASAVSETPAKENSLLAAAAASALSSPDSVALDTPSTLGKRKGDDADVVQEVKAPAAAFEAPSPKAARTEEVAQSPLVCGLYDF